MRSSLFLQNRSTKSNIISACSRRFSRALWPKSDTLFHTTKLLSHSNCELLGWRWSCIVGRSSPFAFVLLRNCYRSCFHGLLNKQVYGGHGYVRANGILRNTLNSQQTTIGCFILGMEQILRDARIATLYEGTTGTTTIFFCRLDVVMIIFVFVCFVLSLGIQALDLIARKVLLNKVRLFFVTLFFCFRLTVWCRLGQLNRANCWWDSSKISP